MVTSIVVMAKRQVLELIHVAYSKDLVARTTWLLSQTKAAPLLMICINIFLGFPFVVSEAAKP